MLVEERGSKGTLRPGLYAISWSMDTLLFRQTNEREMDRRTSVLPPFSVRRIDTLTPEDR